MESLKELRLKNKVSQKYCAELLGISLRSYKDYENDVSKRETIKYKYILEKLTEHFKIDETTGVLTIEQITKKCEPIFKKYNINYAYLFGSYAKGAENPNSDVDILVQSETCTGLKFYELLETLRENLCKKVDLLDFAQLKNNETLFNEILATGVKIYG